MRINKTEKPIGISWRIYRLLTQQRLTLSMKYYIIELEKSQFKIQKF